MTEVWSCGGGTQSAAIAALICDGKLPKPAYSLMVDTEREQSSTWRYVYGTMKPHLSSVGVDLVIIPKSEYATVDLYAKNGDLLIPAYTKDGNGKLPTFCSSEWKRRVLDRWLRAHGVAANEVVYWIGFSTNELRRVRAGRFRYPLIFDYPMRREDCREYVLSLGWPEPPRRGSACWMCPQLSNEQWADMRDNDPDDFAKACEFDEAIRRNDPNVFVHRSGKPLIQIAPEIGNSKQQELFGCESGTCFL